MNQFVGMVGVLFAGVLMLIALDWVIRKRGKI